MKTNESLILPSLIERIPSSDSHPILVDDSSLFCCNKHDLKRLVSSLADQLLSQVPLAGKMGINFAVVMPNCAEYVITFCAVASSGNVNCLLNPNFKKDELEFALKDMDCSFILALPNQGDHAVNLAAEELKIPIFHVILSNGSGAEETSSGGMWTIKLDSPGSPPDTEKSAEGIAGGSPCQKPSPQSSDILLKLHTSGTTAKPKIVPLTHGNVYATALNMRRTYEWRNEIDKSFLVMPLFHVHGLFNGCLAPIFSGVTVVIPSSRSFSRTAFWGDVVKHQPTFVTAVPSIWQILINSYDETYPKDTPPALRYIRACSSSLPAPVASKAEELFKTTMLEAYAMTEGCHQMCSNLQRHRCFGKIGYPQGTEIAIIDPDTLRIVDYGQKGEVCVRGYNVIRGYYKATPEQTRSNFHAPETIVPGASFFSSLPQGVANAKTLDEYESLYLTFDPINNPLRDPAGSDLRDVPFLRTGDVGIMSADGTISLEGRIKELINRGGEKISPLEIDAVLLEFPNVTEAASFGAPDSVMGEQVEACVISSVPSSCHSEEARKLREFLGSKLAKFKVPVKIYFVTNLPKGPTGKTLRRELCSFTRDLDGY